MYIPLKKKHTHARDRFLKYKSSATKCTESNIGKKAFGNAYRRAEFKEITQKMRMLGKKKEHLQSFPTENEHIKELHVEVLLYSTQVSHKHLTAKFNADQCP